MIDRRLFAYFTYHDRTPIGPFKSKEEALKDARERREPVICLGHPLYPDPEEWFQVSVGYVSWVVSDRFNRFHVIPSKKACLEVEDVEKAQAEFDRVLRVFAKKYVKRTGHFAVVDSEEVQA